MDAILEADLRDEFYIIGSTNRKDRIRVLREGAAVFDESRADLLEAWSETSYRMQALRDNPDCAREEFKGLTAKKNPGLHVKLGFDLNEDVAAPFVKKKRAQPRVAILREQGVNGETEMAAAFDRAGFDAGGRAHVRSPGRPRAAVRLQGPGRLRRLLLRRRAGRRFRLGQVHPVQCAAARCVRRHSSNAKTASRSACATAAR
jgi:hypothetical protein